MVQVPPPGDHSNAAPGTDAARFDDSYVAKALDGWVSQLGQASHLVHHPFPTGNGGSQRFPTEQPTLKGRDDIDTAMVEALRQAKVCDRGFPLSGWVASEPDQLGVSPRSGDQGASTRQPLEPARRSDVDQAMPEALGQARVSDSKPPDV